MYIPPLNSVINEKNDKEGKLNLDQRDFLYLKDHLFRGLNVLPGTFIIDVALKASFELYHKLPYCIEELKFLNPVILSRSITVISFKVEEENDDNSTLIFYDEYLSSKNYPPNKPIAKMKLIFNETKNIMTNPDKDVQRLIKSGLYLDSKSFYSRLNKNGNQYGTEFQNLLKIFVKDNLAAAQLRNNAEQPSNDSQIIDPTLIDSAIHLLSAIPNDEGKTFLLDSVERITIFDPCLQGELWSKAQLDTNNNRRNEFQGDVEIFNSSGKSFMQFWGIKFKYFPNEPPANKNNIVFTANFTIDPLVKSLKFWNKYFNSPFIFEFTPYNQVFQTLLDPAGEFAKNDTGINVILLNLEEWLHSRSNFMNRPTVSQEEYLNLVRGKSTYSLPDKTEIVHLNKYETDYLYDEIFVNKSYIRSGITLNDEDTIIDIGANIGLFTLFVNKVCRNPQVFSYEPSPEVFELLKVNARLYGTNTRVYNKGISDKRKKEVFTYYPKSSVFSGFNANDLEDIDTIKQVVRNIIENKIESDYNLSGQYANEFTTERLQKEFYECDLVTISDIIQENKIDKIDLLKIDAEKSELDILNGIRENDWDKIKQVVIEIHDRTGERLKQAETILRERGFQVSIDEEQLLKNTGMWNVYAVRGLPRIDDTSEDLQGSDTALSNNIRNYTEALYSFTENSNSSLILGILPPQPSETSEERTNQLLSDYESDLLSALAPLQNVHCISSRDFINAHRIADYYDPYGKEIGNIPYNETFFGSMGTTIFRKSLSLTYNNYKVIVLDCDNTLWKGICGEDRVDEIQITENFAFLQRFMVDQKNSGKLICLSSKNNEEDVWNVFERRDDMILKKDHIVSSRINWKSKSENLISLATELNLSLDSFIFIDDSPFELAEVKSNCPSVTTLILPLNENIIPEFLQNAWVFDKLKLTNEDKIRTDLYRSNIHRSTHLKNSPSLKAFIEDLNLQISVSEVNQEQLNRVSQLTFRTNQFNFTTIRRSETALKTILKSKNSHCLIIEASDRFGDYGLVGVVIYMLQEKKIRTDTFLLSCRALGRGIEFRILSELGKVALDQNTDIIEIPFIHSKKNRPAWEFINSLDYMSKSENGNEILFKFQPDYLSKLRYEPEDKKISLTTQDRKNIIETRDQPFHSELFQEIAEKLYDIEVLTERMTLSDQANKREIKNLIAPKNQIEQKLYEIWTSTLDVKELSVTDNFFDAGGTSLKSIRLLASIKKEMQIDLSIVDIFENPTIKSLAEKLANWREFEKKEYAKELGERRRKSMHKRRNRKNN